MVKRSVDIAVSAALLLIALPVLAVAAVMILTTSPGPVLFRQTRMGRGFRPFQIIKLRTMVHAEAGLAYTLGPDPRITQIGRWLRRTKVDELPQLWNVLRGDMSLVGPRPVVPELTSEFREFYVHLLRARPGLTDPASLKYSQENRLLARAEDPMRFFKTVVTPDKIQISREYMDRANLWTDTVTLAMTAVICCFPAMSRIYGQLPELMSQRAMAEMALSGAKCFAETAGSQVDESIFSHNLAHLEAAVEEGDRKDALPWIPLQNQNFRAGSAPATVEESA
ncbi:sugar transferase [Acidicapsa acidisoli]|uniref:sugar transferase n=1 Tax=Acidicapsa acidisoli TaxID=1615681 RepID=UPI0021E08F4A|nr:sugar transferase [Acidicapsa acidisoli]